MAYDLDQQNAILSMRASSPASLTDLPDYAVTEQVFSTTFNDRLKLLEALFTDLQDQIRNISVNLNTAALILNGLPRTALANDVQVSLARADTLYPIFIDGISRAECGPDVILGLDLAETAYQKPPGGIPASDLESVIGTLQWHRHRFVQTGSLGLSITFVGTPFAVGNDSLIVTIDGQIQDKEITYTENLDGLGITLNTILEDDQIIILRWYGPA
jgi:hypothetical protein